MPLAAHISQRMMAALRVAPDGGESLRPLLVLAGILVLGVLALPRYHFIDHDVAFLAWAADQMVAGRVYGADILDVNPPLCALIYMPAVFLSQFTGLEWGIRLWMLILSILSLMAFWQTADRSLRLPLATALVLFFLLAYPTYFGQREQMVFLLCAPYVAGSSRHRGWCAVSGIMAGLGFLMKPHFLIALAPLLLLRRRFAIEERAILATGVLYGIIIIFFFRAYVFEMVPAAMETYGAISFPVREILKQGAVIFLTAVPLAAAAASQPAARPYLAAALGFTLAALAQRKGFHYHFIPAFGFLAMYVTATLFNRSRTAAIAATAFLLLLVAFLFQMTVRSYREPAEWNQYRAEIKAEIDRSASFAALSTVPAASFPVAIHTTSRYQGLAISHIFLPAVIDSERGVFKGDAQEAKRLALKQAIRELSRKPELVLVTAMDHDGSYFDVLGWLNQDEGFRELWADYAFYRAVNTVSLYRRK